MNKARILTAQWWHNAVDALTNNIPRMNRTGIQMVIAGYGQDWLGVDLFAMDWPKIGAAYLAGVISWFITTSLAPPRD